MSVDVYRVWFGTLPTPDGVYAIRCRHQSQVPVSLDSLASCFTMLGSSSKIALNRLGTQLSTFLDPWTASLAYSSVYLVVYLDRYKYSLNVDACCCLYRGWVWTGRKGGNR